VNVQVLLWHTHKNMQDIFIVLWAHCNGVQSASIAVDVSLCPSLVGWLASVGCIQVL